MSAISDFILKLILGIDSVVGNLGVTIIIFTIIFRFITLAFTYKSLKSMHKMRDLQPEIKKLQQKYKNDPQALNLAQLEFYKRHNINPLSGCLPQLLQVAMLIIVYQVLISLLNIDGLANTDFLWFNLLHPDSLYIVPIIAAISQFFFSIMTLPGGESPNLVPDHSKKKSIQELNQKEESTAAMAATMQKQMVFMMPLMTGVIALTLPSGLGLYWIISTFFSIGQQYFVSGWGGITLYAKRLQRFFSKS